MRLTCARVFPVIAFAGLLCSPTALTPLAAQGHSADSNGRRLAQFNGLTAGEWLALWWQDQLGTPVVAGGAVDRKNGLRFLGAPLTPPGTPKVTVDITVEPGTPLFLPIITVECSVAESDPFHGDDEAELRACANGNLDLAANLAVAIDGAPVTDPTAYRVESPLFRYGPLPANNLPGLPPGTQSDAVAAGYAMLLPPFSVGVHRIDVHAAVTGVPIGVDAELVITVEPRGK